MGESSAKYAYSCGRLCTSRQRFLGKRKFGVLSDEEGSLLITDQLQSFVLASSSGPFMILVDSQHVE